MNAQLNYLTDEQKINHAVNILMAKTKDFPDLLMKLAELSKSNPIIYYAAIAKLKSL